MNLLLKDQVAMVVGDSQGIGKAICFKFAKAGALVVIVDSNFKNANKTAKMINNKGGSAIAYRMNAHKKKEVNLIFKRVYKKLGKLNILVNNFRTFYLTPFEIISDKEWDKIIQNNLKSTFLCSQMAFNIMKNQGGGKIINIISHSARTGGMVSPGVYIYYAHYAATQAAIECLTKSMAFEGASYGILVNGISAGDVKKSIKEIYPYIKKESISSIIPLGRFGDPEEIASVALFLASNRASYITAKILDINGGMIMD